MSYWNKTGSRQCTQAVPPNSTPFINFNAQELAAACAKELAHVGLQLLEVEKDADELFKWCAQDFTAFIGKQKTAFLKATNQIKFWPPTFTQKRKKKREWHSCSDLMFTFRPVYFSISSVYKVYSHSFT